MAYIQKQTGFGLFFICSWGGMLGVMHGGGGLSWVLVLCGVCSYMGYGKGLRWYGVVLVLCLLREIWGFCFFSVLFLSFFFLRGERKVGVGLDVPRFECGAACCRVWFLIGKETGYLERGYREELSGGVCGWDFRTRVDFLLRVLYFYVLYFFYLSISFSFSLLVS